MKGQARPLPHACMHTLQQSVLETPAYQQPRMFEEPKEDHASFQHGFSHEIKSLS